MPKFGRFFVLSSGRSQWIGGVSLVVIAASVLGGAPASAAPVQTSTQSKPAISAAPGSEISTDIMADGWGDAAGYHVEVGNGGNGFAMRELATLRPAGLDVQSWTGYQCVTGDGRFVGVAVEPTSVVSKEPARDRGAFAYSVEVATGVVTPIASGVALTYYSPGCGSADTAVFTVNLGMNNESTELVEADLATGKVSRTTKVSGQVSSAVPVGSGIVGVAGSSIVSVPTSGPVKVLADVHGDAYDLRPAADGGVNFLVTAGTSAAQAAAKHIVGSRLTDLGSGPRERLQLFQGRNGHAVLAGATATMSAALSAANVQGVSDAKLNAASTNASLDGSALFTEQASKDAPAGIQLLDTRSNAVSFDKHAVSRTKAVTKVAAFTPPDALTPTPPIRSVGHAHPHGDAAAAPAPLPKASSKPAGALKPSSFSAEPLSAATQPLFAGPSTTGLTAQPAGVTPAVAQTPTCAVPPLDPAKQVMQPSPNQVNWASQMIEQGLLTGTTYTRPANYANMGFAAYAPSSDFPPIALSHPSGGSSSVPRSVYNAIMAQESNFSQASWHAPEGTAGDPLIADYYGRANDIISINYAGADCGYGIGQVTDGMHASETGQIFSARGQVKIAVDYQENIAAGLQILEDTWNQLYADGIIANNGDPKYLENWFFATWAYNSGIQPLPQYNNTGCTPGPTCTGPDGTWGMGWANNPANPSYPPNRLPYLQATYADAAHPASWPYEERVVGWMASPILRDSARAYSTPTYQAGQTWIQQPSYTAFCSLAANHCDPTATNTTQTDAGHCMLNDYECWWHAPATWVSSCATSCATSPYEVNSGVEPANTNAGANPVMCSLDTSKVASNAIIVDDQPSPNNLNLQGCSSANENWSSNGTFTYAPGTNSNGDPIGNIDTHQLGSGFGGRILFTHTEDGTNPNVINTGTWTPNLPSLQYYKIKLHLPALGATTTNVIYTINPGGGATPWKIRVNQDWNTDTWVTIGTFAMQNGGNVVLTNQSPVVDTGDSENFNFDVAFDAVAFIPQGGTPGTPIGGPPTVQDAPNGSNPAFVQCGCAQRTAGDPVNTATGYYSETDTDLTTPGRGMALNFTRTYTEATADPNGPNAALAVNGPFGYGWTDSYNLSTITNGSTGAVTVVQEDSSRVVFNYNSSNGVYTAAEARDDATLTKSGTTYTYIRHGRDIYLFDTATGHLTAEQDLAGAHATTPYKTSLGYNASGQLSTITDPDNRVYTLTWTGGHITQLKDAAGRTVTYSYDASNDLSGVYGVGTTRSPSVLNDDLTTYAYNTTTHLMTAFRSPKNQGGASTAHVVMTYDTSERVLTQTDADGRVTTFNYGPSTSPSLVAGQTLVTDPSGHKTLDTYQGGLLVSETKGYGTSVAATWKYTYDPATLGVTTMSDPAGNLSTYSYDEHGNRVSASDPDGHVANSVYDNAGDVLETIDPAGVATVHLYDQAGHIKTSSTTTNNGTFTYGDLTSTTVTQANNVVESNTGNFGSAPTRTTNYYYDDPAHPGDANRMVDPRGLTTTTYYDAAGDVSKQFDALGHTAVSNWDTTRGWLNFSIAPNGIAAGVTTCAPIANGCTAYGHDAWGHVTSTTDALSHVNKASYDADGNKITATDQDNNLTKYTYDPAEQLTLTTQADNTTLSTVYNGDGSKASIKDAANNVTLYGYDGQGRLSTVTDPDNRVTTTGYNTAGYVTTVKDNLARTTTSTVDVAGRITAISYSDGVTPNVSNIAYDADNRRTSMTDGTGISTWTYDTFGELISSTNGAAQVVGYGYDADGNQTSITYPDGKVITNGYDNANRFSSVTDAASRQTTFGYSADGQLLTTSFNSGNSVTNGFNNADQLTSTTVKQGTTTLGALTYGRDNAGQLSSTTPSGSLPGAAQTFGYTALNQVKTAVAGTTTTSYGYDPANNITTNDSVTAKYDPANQLCWSTTATVTGTPACAAPPTGATAYTYNGVGQRTKTTPSSGTASTYSYNQAGRLTSAVTPGGTNNAAYNGDGLRTKTALVGVSTTFYTYGLVSGSTQLLTNGATDFIYGPGGAPIEQTSSSATNYFVHDQLGSTIALLSTAGAIAGTYTYNTYGKATAHTGVSTPLGYGGGYTDSSSGLIYLQARYYDPTTAQFLTVDPALTKTGQAYAYANNNPLNAVDPSGLSWYDPTSWSADDWATGLGVVAGVAGIAALTIATGGADIAVLGGLAGVGEVASAVGIGDVSVGAAVFALDTTAAVAGGTAAGIDCRNGISAQCVTDGISAASGAGGAWSDFGYAPELWGQTLGMTSLTSGLGSLLYTLTGGSGEGENSDGEPKPASPCPK